MFELLLSVVTDETSIRRSSPQSCKSFLTLISSIIFALTKSSSQYSVS